jgi:hypothetical protein
VLTLVLITLILFTCTAAKRAGGRENAFGAAERRPSIQFLGSTCPGSRLGDRALCVRERDGRNGLSASNDPLAYWHSLAVKRLHLLGKREHRIVRLLEVVHKLRGSPSSSGGIAHRVGWLCIHSREGAWNANTGNGYYGGLQAHLNWYGVYRMDLLSAEAQMAHAETVYRSTGYSHSWLAGQWPNTYPPCAGLF